MAALATRWVTWPRPWLPRPTRQPEASTPWSKVEVYSAMIREGDSWPGDGYLLPHCCHDTTGRIRDNVEGHNKTMTRSIVGEPPPCQQCCHDRHCGTTPCHTMAWRERSWQPIWWPYPNVWWCQDKTGWISSQDYLLLLPSGSWPLGSGESISPHITWPLNSI